MSDGDVWKMIRPSPLVERKECRPLKHRSQAMPILRVYTPIDRKPSHRMVKSSGKGQISAKCAVHMGCGGRENTKETKKALSHQTNASFVAH